MAESDHPDGEEHHQRKPFRQPKITLRRVIAVVGFVLIAKGYDMLSVAPDAPAKDAIDGGIFGILTVIVGAGLAVFAVLFN